MTVWVLVLQGRQFGVDIRVFNNERAAVSSGMQAMGTELAHWKYSKPDRESHCPGTDEPYYACTDDGLTVQVLRKEVQP